MHWRARVAGAPNPDIRRLGQFLVTRWMRRAPLPSASNHSSTSTDQPRDCDRRSECAHIGYSNAGAGDLRHPARSDFGFEPSVWSYPGVNSFSRSGAEGNLLALHPTVKPVALVADALRDCSSRGEIVLDAFLGSGTTLIAAERTGRNCRGLELDPAYVDTAIRRW